MKYPAVTVSLWYVAGILLAWQLAFPLFLLFGICFFLIIAALAQEKRRPYLLALLLLFAGWTNFTSRMAILSPDDLRLMTNDSSEWIVLRGVLVETPWERIQEFNNRSRIRTIATLDVEALSRKDKWFSTSGRVIVSTAGSLPDIYFHGKRVEIRGVLRPPAGPMAEGLFDYAQYLKWTGIYHQLMVESVEDWSLLEGGASRMPLEDRFCNWAKEVLGRDIPDEDVSLRLVWAMALGWKTALTQSVSTPFIQTGTMHVFAISGMHIALLAFILISLLRVLRVPRAGSALLVVPVIWFYTAATGWQASAIRSALMMTVVLGGWILNRPGNLLNSLAISGFIILIWEPQQLFEASFQLSFFVVLSLALLTPPLEKVRDYWLSPDPLQAASLIPKWKQWAKVPVHWLLTSVATSLAAWVGSMPIIVNYFHTISPSSLVANLVVIPLSTMGLMCHLGSLVCGDLLKPLTILFNHAGWFFMWLMVAICNWLSSVRGAYFYVRPLSPSETLLFYMIASLLFLGWSWSKKARWTCGGVALIAAALVGLEQMSQWGHHRISMLALSSGQAIYIDSPGKNHDLLVDCGHIHGVELLTHDFLAAQGVNRLNAILLTHGDAQHIGGYEKLADSFQVRRLFINPTKTRSPFIGRILERAHQDHVEVQAVQYGNRLLEQWEVLHPGEADRFSKADDMAIVLRGHIHGIRVLLLSDLGERGQKELLNRCPDIQAEILIAGIASDGRSLLNPLLDKIQPKIIILCTGKPPKKGGDGIKTTSRSKTGC